MPIDWEIPDKERETFTASKEFINATYRLSFLNPEENLGRGEKIYTGAMTSSQEQNVKDKIQEEADMLSKEDHPFVFVDQPISITPNMIQNYNPYTNFYEGQMGWNINDGGNLTEPIIAGYGEDNLIIGGRIEVSGNLLGIIKEFFFRRGAFKDTEYGIMKQIPEDPTDDQKAAYYFQTKFEDASMTDISYTMKYLENPE